ncbi:MAG: DUF3187 family protein [SAR324 cluster bacterium]|nr:DUF3187 family protein [SAR324 cluster bacterium]
MELRILILTLAWGMLVLLTAGPVRGQQPPQDGGAGTLQAGGEAGLPQTEEHRFLPPGWFPDQKGPIRVRNLFPLSLPFLGFLPDEQMFLPPGHLVAGITMSLSNTYARTGGITAGRTEGVRNPFREADFDRVIADNPGTDQFFLDMETLRVVLLFTYGVTEDLQVDVELPFLAIGGGILDNLIQEFHDTLGLGQSNRTTFPKNATTLALFLNGEKLFRSGFSYKGLGDVVVSAKWPIYEGAEGDKFLPKIDARVAVKLPTGDADRLLGSGHTDYGIGVASSILFGRGCLHLNLGAIFPGDWDLLPGLDPDPIYSLLVAWEFLLGANPDISYLIQDKITTSPFRTASDTELAELSHEVSFGMKIDLTPNDRITLALTENHSGFNNSSDIGFHFGYVTSFGQI